MTSPLQQGIKKTSELVRGGLPDLREMRPPVTAVHSRRQHQSVQLHHPPNALAVVAGPKGPVHHCPDPTVAVGGPALGHRVDLLHDRVVVGPLVPPAGAGPGAIVGGAPRDGEDGADRRHRVCRHRPDSLRNAGVFLRPPGRPAGSPPPSSCGPAPARALGSSRTPRAAGWPGPRPHWPGRPSWHRLRRSASSCG
jgi:hypothetical protein